MAVTKREIETNVINGSYLRILGSPSAYIATIRI